MWRAKNLETRALNQTLNGTFESEKREQRIWQIQWQTAVWAANIQRAVTWPPVVISLGYQDKIIPSRKKRDKHFKF